ENGVDVTNFRFVIDQKFPHPADGDWRGMNQLFGLAEFLHELGNTTFIKENLPPVWFDSLVGQVNLQSLVQKGEFPESGCEDVKLKFSCDSEYLGIGQKRDQSAGESSILHFT